MTLIFPHSPKCPVCFHTPITVLSLIVTCFTELLSLPLGMPQHLYTLLLFTSELCTTEWVGKVSVSSTELGASPAQRLDFFGACVSKWVNSEAPCHLPFASPTVMNCDGKEWVKLSLMFDCAPRGSNSGTNPKHTLPLKTCLGSVLPLGKPSACLCTWAQWLFHSGHPSFSVHRSSQTSTPSSSWHCIW